MVGNRYETRRRKKMSRILNIAIGVVIVLILVVGVSIVFNGNSDETANQNNESNTDNGTNQTGSGSAAIKDPASSDDNDDNAASEDDDENQDSVADGRTEDDDDATADDDSDADMEDATEDEDREEDGQEDEEQEPLGTEQTGEFKPDFTQGSQNWNEMVAAVGSPQGLSSQSEMTLWRLENGGSPTSAVGTFSDKNEQDSYSNPYRVRIEWQDGQGWQVVSTEQLSSNPYR
ncbi:YrrS family protein [Alkalicoccobacillus gibsonii]|uniref:YrrS family protein n=1 Tax=Alkalicoccobacillus gibsonii TaxID=79881 RepID=A0ABU9VGK0_9BACI